jgi:hypothetical protein
LRPSGSTRRPHGLGHLATERARGRVLKTLQKQGLRNSTTTVIGHSKNGCSEYAGFRNEKCRTTPRYSPYDVPARSLIASAISRAVFTSSPIPLRIRVADPEAFIVAEDGVLLFVVLLSRLPYYSPPELTHCRACPRKPSCGHDTLQGYLAQSQFVL